jgi:hypothetical protein
MWSFFNVPLKGHIRQVWLQFKMQYYEVLIIRGINFQDFHGLFIQYMILNPKYKKSKSHITIEHVNVTLTLSSITHGWSRSDTLHSSLVGQLTHGWWMESIRVWKGYLHSPHDEHRPSPTQDNYNFVRTSKFSSSYLKLHVCKHKLKKLMRIAV